MKKIIYLSLVIILIFSLINIPILAQNSPQNQSEEIVIDGREFFKVGSYELFPAQTRANWINSQIKQVIESEEKPQVRVEERNKSPIIILNERYLLTVTEEDSEGLKPAQQANLWASQIEEGIKKAQTERNKSVIVKRLLFSVIIIIWAIAVHWFLGRLWKKSYGFWVKILQLEENENKDNDIKVLKLVLNSTLLIIRLGLWAIICLYISNLFPVTRIWSYRISDSLIDSFTITFISIGKNSYSIIDFLILITLLVLLFLIANTLAKLLQTKVLNLSQIEKGISQIITTVTKYTFITIGTIVILQVWGFDLSSLTIFASAIGVAIGFGFQDIAKNFGSGLVLLFERPIKVGDFVEIGDSMGLIEYIGPRSTLIRTLDQVSIIVPNSRFLENEVINWSHHNPISRLHIPVGVSYNSDVKLVRIALLESVNKCSDILLSPAPQVLFKGFGDSAIDFELLVWVQDPSKQPIIISELFFAIEDSFKKYNIEIPFPQTDLHFRSGEVPLQLSPGLENKINKLLNKND